MSQDNPDPVNDPQPPTPAEPTPPPAPRKSRADAALRDMMAAVAALNPSGATPSKPTATGPIETPAAEAAQPDATPVDAPAEPVAPTEPAAAAPDAPSQPEAMTESLPGEPAEVVDPIKAEPPAAAVIEPEGPSAEWPPAPNAPASAQPLPWSATPQPWLADPRVVGPSAPYGQPGDFGQSGAPVAYGQYAPPGYGPTGQFGPPVYGQGPTGQPGWNVHPQFGAVPAGPQPGVEWFPHAGPPSPLPDVPREYHEFYRTPLLRWWRPLVAMLSFVGAWLICTVVVSAVAIFADIAAGSDAYDDLARAPISRITPTLFLANNLTLALAIPLAMLFHRLFFKQSTGWLFSIVGRLRWGLFGRFLLLALPVFLLMFAIEIVLSGWPTGLSVRPETWFLLASILLTTPLQAAGEEIAMRGFGARLIAAWIPSRQVGLVVATAITSVVFMLLHGAGDPWLNVHYLWFGVVASVLVWKTGGLEASFALHVVNNLVGLAFVPFTGVSDLFNRESGVGSPVVLIQLAIVTFAAALMLWQAKRSGLPTSAAPGAPAGTVEAAGFYGSQGR